MDVTLSLNDVIAGTFTSTTTDQSNVRLVDRLMSGGVGTAGMLLTGAVMLSGIIAMTSRKGGLSATTMGYRVFAQGDSRCIWLAFQALIGIVCCSRDPSWCWCRGRLQLLYGGKQTQRQRSTLIIHPLFRLQRHDDKSSFLIYQ